MDKLKDPISIGIDILSLLGLSTSAAVLELWPVQSAAEVPSHGSTAPLHAADILVG